MVYAETGEWYNELYEELKKLPQLIMDYFNKNWHECRTEWPISNNYLRHSFGNDTNNRLELLNAKIKKDLDRFMSLKGFVKNFLTFTDRFHRERDHKAAASYQKTKIFNYHENTPEFL